MRGRPPRGGRPRCMWLMGNCFVAWRLRLAAAHGAFAVSGAKNFRLPAAAELLFSCVAKRKVTKREGHPTWRLPGIHARQVREPAPGFSTGHPALAKRNRHPCRLPLRGLSTPSHRRTGAPGRAAVHPGPHSVRNRCAVARAEEPKGRLFELAC